MKKIVPIIVSILLFTLILSGCDEDETDDEGHEKDEIGSRSNFIGTWMTIGGGGSYTEGNSIRFNDDTFEKFWNHSGSTLFSGTWSIRYVVGEYPKLIMTQGEMTYNYTYNFYDGYTLLELIAEGATAGVRYEKI